MDFEKIIEIINNSNRITAIEDLFNNDLIYDILTASNINFEKNKSRIVKNISGLIVLYMIDNNIITKDSFRNALNSMYKIYEREIVLETDVGVIKYIEESILGYSRFNNCSEINNIEKKIGISSMILDKLLNVKNSNR